MTLHRHAPYRSLIVLAGLIVCGGSRAASAQTIAPSDPPVVRVATQDLNLELVSDQKILDKRITSAAQTVCREWKENPDFAGYGKCLANARKSASAQRDALVERAKSRESVRLADMKK